MPSIGLNYSIDTYRFAKDLPSLVWDTFNEHPCDSNVMFPHAEKCRELERNGHPSSGLWVTCTTSQGFGESTLDFILSCTEGPLGSYPVFIFTPYPAKEHHSDYSRRRIRSMVHRLAKSVPSERVFSVFAPEQITRLFAFMWTEETGIGLDAEACYYAAKISYCTRKSLRPKQHTMLPGVEYELRLATEDDIHPCAELCYGFADESKPFVLSADGALNEARVLISKRQLWVHEIRRAGQAPEIASIVAVTRTSETVAGITKVYTNPRWRQRGCAERLTRKVCKHLLKNKDRVVLYVAHNNPAAAKVYDRVGFLGLGPTSAPVEGVDSWLELGFDRKHVTLGHW